MKFDLINIACDAACTFETAENRSSVYKALDALAHKDFQKYREVLSEFADSAKTQEDYNRFRMEVMGAPLPPKPTATEVLGRCLNGDYGRGPQLIVERLKNGGPNVRLMKESIITLMKPYGFILTEQEIAEAIKEL